MSLLRFRLAFQGIYRRSLIIIFLVSICLTLVIGSCALKSTFPYRITPTPNPALHVLRMGYQPQGVGLLLKVKGSLEKRLASQAISVEWSEFPAGPALLAAMGEGKIDMGYAGVVPPIFAQAKGIPFVYVANELPATNSIGILVQENSRIKTLADLKGKKIAVTQSSAAHYLLIRALFQGGLSLENVELVDLPPIKGVAAFKQGKVDVWVGWNPFLAELQSTFPVRLLTNAKGLMNDRNFYFATQSFANNHRELVKIVIEEMRKTGDWLKQNPREAATILATQTRRQLPIILKDLESRRFQAQPIQDRAIEDQQRIAETFFRLGLLPKRIWVEDAVWKLGL